MSRSKDVQMARYLAGEMTTKEEIAYLSGIEKSQDELAELKNMEKNWRYFDQNPSQKDWDSEKAWGRLHEKLDTEGLLEDQAGAPEIRSAAAHLVSASAPGRCPPVGCLGTVGRAVGPDSVRLVQGGFGGYRFALAG